MAKIDTLFDALMARGGSALHLGVGCPPLGRVRGELVPLRESVAVAAELEEALLELCTPAQRDRLNSELELELLHVHGDAAHFRVDFFMKSSGLGAVFRLVPRRVLTLAELGYPEVLRRFAERPSGLVLVAGPSSSGKSTTLAAMLDHVNQTRACHILTVEKPIEFVHEPIRAQITQRAVGVHASSRAVALRSAWRENADVVFTSDLENVETTMLALQLAQGGALVFALVPANGVVATVERFVNALPIEEEPQIRTSFADSLVGIVSQQLVRTADGEGRVAVQEILVGSSAASAMIRDGKSAQLTGLMSAGQAQGMQTVDVALERLLLRGRISAEDALDRAVDRVQFAQIVARLRPDLVERIP